MRDELKKKWIEALRSKKFEQGQNAMNSNGKFCCLGVLCEVLELPKKAKQSRDICIEDYFVYDLAGTDTSLGVFRSSQLKLLEISILVQRALYMMNDGIEREKQSFAQIADWIEQHDLESGEVI